MTRFTSRYLLAVLLFAIAGCSKEDVAPVTPPVTPNPPVNSDTVFTNPLLSSGSDPWVIKKDSFYYYTHTDGNRIRIWKTKSMSRLNYASAVTIWTKPATGANSENVWAPELHFINNKWYMYYTAGGNLDQSLQRLFVLENSSADPTTGTWIDRGKLADPAADFWAIDADLFVYNSNLYIVWSGHANDPDYTQHIYIAKMKDPLTLASSRADISFPQYSWEKFGSAPGGLPAVNEGPQLILNPAGKPILVFSASGCWTDDYCMGMSLLKDGGDPLNAGDWVKSSNPVFVQNPANRAFGPGHCAFFKSPDGTQDWLLYHANSFNNQGCGDVRNPRMQKFTWNPDGTPNFGVPVKINTPIIKPSGE